MSRWSFRPFHLIESGIFSKNSAIMWRRSPYFTVKFVQRLNFNPHGKQIENVPDLELIKSFLIRVWHRFTSHFDSDFNISIASVLFLDDLLHLKWLSGRSGRPNSKRVRRRPHIYSLSSRCSLFDDFSRCTIKKFSSMFLVMSYQKSMRHPRSAVYQPIYRSHSSG